MKKIACIGYHYTGSGVIDDLFRECDNVYQGLYEAELRFLHDPDGISDLEYNLVQNPHRLSSTLAIKRFVDYARRSSRQVQQIVGKDWMNLVNDYVDKITLLKYPGYIAGDMLFFSGYQKIVDFCVRAYNKISPPKFRFPKDSNHIPSAITYYSRLDEEFFLDTTRKFVEKVCSLANKENKEFIMLDQFIGANNPSRYLRYANDLKAIIVDRDPRDLYISRIKVRDRLLPSDPHEFCIYYRNIRKTTGKIPYDNCMYVRFEDMIYNYEENVNKVFEFIGIDKSHHKDPKKCFNPSVSINGTKLWERYPQYEEAVKIIERELPEYLYKY